MWKVREIDGGVQDRTGVKWFETKNIIFMYY